MRDIPSDNYKVRIEALDNIVRDCISVSNACEGIRSPTGSHFWASVLFTTLCTRAVSVAIVLPYSPWSQKLIEQWDYSSIMCLTRPLLETRLAFYYLCTEICPEDEWYFRWNLFNIHDCRSRIHLFSEMPPQSENIAGFEEQLNELQKRLRLSPFFNHIPGNKQKQFLNGNNAYLEPLEDIAVRAGIDLSTFRWFYKLSSNQVHGLPMSFYRMGEQERGRGVYSDVEEKYTSLCLSFIVSMLVKSRDEMKEKFRGLVSFS